MRRAWQLSWSRALAWLEITLSLLALAPATLITLDHQPQKRHYDYVPDMREVWTMGLCYCAMFAVPGWLLLGSWRWRWWAQLFPSLVLLWAAVVWSQPF